jgi:hypothetical protein
MARQARSVTVLVDVDALPRRLPQSVHRKRHQLGGEPTLLQKREAPTCPSCEQSTTFYAQIDSINDDPTALSAHRNGGKVRASSFIGSGFNWNGGIFLIVHRMDGSAIHLARMRPFNLPPRLIYPIRICIRVTGDELGPACVPAAWHASQTSAVDSLQVGCIVRDRSSVTVDRRPRSSKVFVTTAPDALTTTDACWAPQSKFSDWT